MTKVTGYSIYSCIGSEQQCKDRFISKGIVVDSVELTRASFDKKQQHFSVKIEGTDIDCSKFKGVGKLLSFTYVASQVTEEDIAAQKLAEEIAALTEGTQFNNG